MVLQNNLPIWFKLYYLLLCGLTGLSPSISNAQLCSGNLGDNIFTDGNFGSGAANIVPNDPGLAPGFIYTTNVPPDDGYYTLTNDIAMWSNVFGAWLQIGDNDIDPQGYMMVVNASFEPGIFYQKTIDNLCENTLYEVSADVINLIRANITGHSAPNISFLVNDAEVYATGNIPKDEQWHTYGFTFVNPPGQTSAKLTLRNNAPGGIGNDLALDNISFRACGPDTDISISPPGRICEDILFQTVEAQISADTGFVQWQVSADGGLNWSAVPGATSRTYTVQQLNAGDYFFRYIYGNTVAALSNPKCRIVSLALPVEVVPLVAIIRDTLCEGMEYAYNGSIYTETGIYYDTLVAQNGCDSIVELQLEFVSDPMIEAVFGTQPASCEGANDGSAFLVSISDLRPPYYFTVNDSIIPPPSLAATLPAGTYTVGIVTPDGCSFEEEVTVPDGPPLDVQTSEDTTIRIGETILIQSIVNLPVDTVYWLPAQALSCPYCLDTYAMPTDETTYVIHVETDAGCVDSAAITVRVDRTTIRYIPNVFSPNGDQINDEFYLTDPFSITAIEEALIFDRWGGIIARTGPTPAASTVLLWDGQTKKGPAMPGIYVYVIKVVLADGSKETVSGDVTVLR